MYARRHVHSRGNVVLSTPEFLLQFQLQLLLLLPPLWLLQKRLLQARRGSQSSFLRPQCDAAAFPQVISPPHSTLSRNISRTLVKTENDI